MNKDQQKTVNEMLDAMELDTYGEKGLKEIIRQMAVEIVKQASQKRKPIFNYVSPDYITGEYLEADVCNWNLTVGALKDCDHVYVNGVRYVEFQPDINTQYLLDQVSRLTAENAMLKEKWSPSKREPLGLEIMDVCGSEDYREGFKDGALYAEKCHGIGIDDE